MHMAPGWLIRGERACAAYLLGDFAQARDAALEVGEDDRAVLATLGQRPDLHDHLRHDAQRPWITRITRITDYEPHGSRFIPVSGRQAKNGSRITDHGSRFIPVSG